MGRRLIYGFSFSWKRATGLSTAKSRLSRQLGVPLTRSGRQRKLGRMLGCCVPIAIFLGLMVSAAAWAKDVLELAVLR